MKKIFLSFVLVSVLALFVGTTIFLYQKSNEPPEVYQTTTPFVTDIVHKTVATGKIVPRKEVEVKSKVSGVVSEIYVEAGHAIERGDLIARIELIPDMAFLSNAESELEKARINFRNADRELNRQQRLFENQLTSEHEFNQFQLRYELAKESYRAAENNVALIKDGVSNVADRVSNIVTATASGVLLDVPVKQGNFVIETNTFNEGTTIASIADMNDMIFEGNVDESEVGKLREGMPLELNVGAIGDARFLADLEYISPKGNEDEGTVQFEIRAAVSLDADYFLRAGYSANADIVLDRREQVIAINEGNLIIDNDQTFVEIATGRQQFQRRKISTGLSDGINIEILSGLNINDAIKQL